jgi:hypothetical protein
MATATRFGRWSNAFPLRLLARARMTGNAQMRKMVQEAWLKAHNS